VIGQPVTVLTSTTKWATKKQTADGEANRQTVDQAFITQQPTLVGCIPGRVGGLILTIQEERMINQPTGYISNSRLRPTGQQ
jgi:hypothetical protein